MATLPKRVPQPTPPVVFPEAEQRLLSERPIEPAIRKAIVEENNVRPPYSRIRVPVVAVYRTTTKEQALKEYPPQNDKERAAFEQGYVSLQAMVKKWQRDLLAGVPNAKVVELPRANLYMFLSNEADVIRELHEIRKDPEALRGCPGRPPCRVRHRDQVKSAPQNKFASDMAPNPGQHADSPGGSKAFDLAQPLLELVPTGENSAHH